MDFEARRSTKKGSAVWSGHDLCKADFGVSQRESAVEVDTRLLLKKGLPKNFTNTRKAVDATSQLSCGRLQRAQFERRAFAWSLHFFHACKHELLW